MDPQPAITFSEQDGIRFLHFGSRWVQGAMRLTDPYSLELAYVKDMMAWLLFLEPPARILQLGLGAGSLTKFCRRHCAGSRVTVVEVSRVVIEEHAEHAATIRALATADDLPLEPDGAGVALHEHLKAR